MRPFVLSVVLASLTVTFAARAQTPEANPAPVDGPAAGVTSQTAIDGATYDVRLRDNQARVEEIADKIRRLRIQLALLSGVSSIPPAAARLEIEIDNEMTRAFRLVHARVVVDDVVQLDKPDSGGDLARQNKLPIAAAAVPGNHTVRAVMTYRGEGFGIFTYLRGYTFELTSSYTFAVGEGKTARVVGTAYEGGDETTPLQQRPRLTWSMPAGPTPNTPTK